MLLTSELLGARLLKIALPSPWVIASINPLTLCSMTIQDGHEPRAEVTEVTSHSMDRKIQVSAKEESAEGQGTEKNT